MSRSHRVIAAALLATWGALIPWLVARQWRQSDQQGKPTWAAPLAQGDPEGLLAWGLLGAGIAAAMAILAVRSDPYRRWPARPAQSPADRLLEAVRALPDAAKTVLGAATAGGIAAAAMTWGAPYARIPPERIPWTGWMTIGLVAGATIGARPWRGLIPPTLAGLGGMFGALAGGVLGRDWVGYRPDIAVGLGGLGAGVGAALAVLAADRAWLIVRKGPFAGWALPLVEKRIVLGSNGANSAIPFAKEISPIACSIERSEEGGFTLKVHSQDVYVESANHPLMHQANRSETRLGHGMQIGLNGRQHVIQFRSIWQRNPKPARVESPRPAPAPPVQAPTKVKSKSKSILWPKSKAKPAPPAEVPLPVAVASGPPALTSCPTCGRKHFGQPGLRLCHPCRQSF